MYPGHSQGTGFISILSARVYRIETCGFEGVGDLAGSTNGFWLSAGLVGAGIEGSCLSVADFVDLSAQKGNRGYVSSCHDFSAFVELHIEAIAHVLTILLLETKVGAAV